MPSFSLAQLADLTQSSLIGNADVCIEGVEELNAARENHAAFLENPRYEKNLLVTKAGVIFVQPNQKIVEGKNYLLNPSPSLAFQKVIELFLPKSASAFISIHPTSIIHPTAKIGKDVTIGPYVVIDQGAEINDRTTIHAACFIGAYSFIGYDCFLHPHVTIRERCILKDRVIIQPGAVIGSSGFGYHTDQNGRHIYLEQLGNVILENDVEIGANTTIDRARFKSTHIDEGTKVDNLVQIAHAVEVGRQTLIVSQVGIAGSTKIGSNVRIGGQVGVNGHIEICDNTAFAARAAISKTIDKPGIYSGEPAMPIKEFNLFIAKLRSIHKIIDRLKELERKISEFTKK